MDDGSHAIERVVARFADLLRAAGIRRGLSDSEIDEVTQELRLRLWKGVSAGETAEALPTWYVQQAVRSAIIDRVRRRRAHRDGGPLHDDSAALPLDALATTRDTDFVEAQRQLGEQIDHALSQLADARRPIVRMWLIGYTREEIARTMGWTDAKVRNLLYRGLDDLRAILRASGTVTDR
jgi:RNA polymerase sigma-70 factor (ECF subfamily)